MTAMCALNGHAVTSRHAKGLQTNGNFDIVVENTKPESGNSGLRTINSLDSCSESGKNGTSYTPILPDAPNLYKHNGVLMENLGYFIIPRSVTSDTRYKSARLKYKHVLHILFENAAFAPTTHAIGTEKIPIAIGQFCVSERQLVELCNEGVRFKDDKVDKNIVHRAVHFWQTCQFVSQKVIHEKNLITITVPEFYKRDKLQSEPESEPKVNHNRTIKEEDKEDKEDNNISSEEVTFVPSSFATSLLNDFYSSLFLNKPDYPKQKAKKTKSQYQAAERLGKKCNYDIEYIKSVIAYAHRPGEFWIAHVHSVVYLENKFPTLTEQMKNLGKKPIQNQKPESLHNKKFQKDDRPVQYKNKISFK